MATPTKPKKTQVHAASSEAKSEPSKTVRAPKVARAASVPDVELRDPLQRRRIVVGEVVSDKMQKTIVVKVDRHVRHGFYKKYVIRSRRFKAHDEKNTAKIGDRVALVESRPLSREKRWVLQSIVRKAGQVIEANV